MRETENGNNPILYVIIGLLTAVLIAVVWRKRKGLSIVLVCFVYAGFYIPSSEAGILAPADPIDLAGGAASTIAEATMSFYGSGEFPFDPLSASDSGYIPEDPRGEPSLPSSCRPKNIQSTGANRDIADEARREECECLAGAHADLKYRRRQLQKLTIIAQHNKDYTDQMISFGDAYSAVHAVSAMAWNVERREILKSIAKFDRTYQNKYEEMIADLYEILMKIDECEAKLGNENWYGKSGFMYYEFMKLRYASYK